MMLNIKRTTDPTDEPITLDEAKNHLRVDGPDDDALIESLIMAAREYAEEHTHRSLLTQVWTWTLAQWPGRCFDIPRPPLVSVDTITITDANDAVTVMPSSDYIVTDGGSQKSTITLKTDATLPTLAEANGVVIEFTAGYGDSASVPKIVRQAMLLLIGHWYENREEVLVTPGATAVSAPTAAINILNIYRAW